MKKFNILSFVVVIFLFSCSDDSSGIEDVIVSGWQLDRIRVEGVDCMAVFGDDVSEVYLADPSGCAKPLEILGNAKRCTSINLQENGQGFFLWSQINGGEDLPITYEIINDEMEFCFEGFNCTGPFTLEGNNLELIVPLRLDQDCKAIYVLRPM